MMLDVNHVYKTFHPGTINERRALAGVDLHLEEGDFVTVIGGNGAGKSTLLNAVAGVWPVDGGSIVIDGNDITGLPDYKRAPFIGRVFQDPMMGTAPDMQLEENLALAYRRGKKLGLRWHINREERDMYRERLRELNLGLEDRLTTKVGLLSGGQRQAVTLLMASLQQPRAAAARRAHRRARPGDGGKGAGAFRPHRAGKRSHHHDDHPQHEGRHPPRQPAHHDEQG